MCNTVPLDASGRPLSRAIIWMDSRADEQAVWVIRRLGGRRVLMRVVGVLPTGKDIVCKWMWLRENARGIWDETFKFLDTTGYLVYKACNRMIADHTAGGSTGLLDSKTRDWSPLFLRLLRIPREKLPDTMGCVEVAGLLTPEAAGEMGLPAGIAVIAGMADIPSAATGSGALEEGDAHVNLGTSSWLCISVRKPRNLGKYGIAPVVSPDTQMTIMIGESETAGACLKWFVDNFATPQDWERAKKGDDIFAIMDELAEGVEPGAAGLIFTPWMFGERSPVADTTLRGAFANIKLEHRRDHLLRAIFEGVAYNLRWMLEAAAGAGFPCPVLRAIGGGAKSDLWMQVLADVTRRRVEAVEHPQEAGALGSALAVAVALGIYGNFKEIKRVVRVRRTFEPDGRISSLYTEIYDCYRSLYPALSKIGRRLNAADRSFHELPR
jgi:xylulokinase